LDDASHLSLIVKNKGSVSNQDQKKYKEWKPEDSLDSRRAIDVFSKSTQHIHLVSHPSCSFSIKPLHHEKQSEHSGSA